MFDFAAHGWSVWLLIALIAGLLELILPYFTFIFVCLAGLVTALAAVWLGLELQVLVFCASLLMLLFTLRPLLYKKTHIASQLTSRSQALLGMKGEVTEAIDPIGKSGRVMVNGEDWSAQSSEPLNSGRAIEVVGHDGIVLLVKGI
jgi:membrane protein implicated in regulation of membrane protease activity